MTFPSISSVLIGVLFGASVAFLAYKVHALSLSGSVIAAILGALIFGFGGIGHTIALLTFFLTSSFLSRLFKRKKAVLDEKYSKGHRRDAWQVLANGGVAGVIVLAGVVFQQQQTAWWFFCASLAAATADTWATELGVLSPVQPRMLTSWQLVEKGTSGGISLVGSLSAIAGSLLLAFISVIIVPTGVKLAIFVAIAGLAGSVVDSYLGATIQVQYKCQDCGRITEKYPLHSCGGSTTIYKGWVWLNNDWVNAACTVSAPLLLGLLMICFG